MIRNRKMGVNRTLLRKTVIRSQRTAYHKVNPAILLNRLRHRVPQRLRLAHVRLRGEAVLARRGGQILGGLGEAVESVEGELTRAFGGACSTSKGARSTWHVHLARA